MRLEQILNEEQINDLYYDEGIGDVARATGRGLAKVGSGLAKGTAGVARAGAIGAGGIAGGLMGAWDAAKQGYQWGRGAVGQGEFGGAPPLVRSSPASGQARSAPASTSQTSTPSNVNSILQAVSSLPPGQQQQLAQQIRQNLQARRSGATPNPASAASPASTPNPASAASPASTASTAPAASPSSTASTTPASGSAPSSDTSSVAAARTGTTGDVDTTTVAAPSTPRRPTVVRGGRNARRVEPTVPGDADTTAPASSTTPAPSSTDVAASAEARRIARQRAAQNRIDRELASGPATPMDRVRSQAQMVASNPPPARSSRKPPSGSFAGREPEQPTARTQRAALPPSNTRRLPPPNQAESVDYDLLNRIVRKSQIILDRKL